MGTYGTGLNVHITYTVIVHFTKWILSSLKTRMIKTKSCKTCLPGILSQVNWSFLENYKYIKTELGNKLKRGKNTHQMQPTVHKAYHLLQEIIFCQIAQQPRNCPKYKNVEIFFLAQKWFLKRINAFWHTLFSLQQTTKEKELRGRWEA